MTMEIVPSKTKSTEAKVKIMELIASKIKSGEYILVEESKLRSAVWQTFCYVVDCNGKRVENCVVCRKCIKVYPFLGHKSGTSNLLKHKCSGPVSESVKVIKKKLSSQKRRVPVTVAMKNTTTKQIVNFVSRDIHPYDTISGEGFLEFAQYLIDIGAKHGAVPARDLIPHPTTVSCNVKEIREDRKVDLSSFGGANSASSGGQNENSLGSGDIHGPADEVSVPLSPEQFLTEEMEHGVSPPTPTQRPESYKLRHNNHLSLVLESLAGDESFMDVTLTAQGKAIKAHKSVLSAVSPYFRSVLKENPCQHPIIIMPRDIRFEELNNIISYVYKGEMTVAAEELSSLLKTAEVLQVTGLSPSETVGSTSGSFIGQTQGLPSGICPSTPLICSPNAYFNYKTSSKKSTDQVTASQQNEDIPQNAIQSESRERIDPLDFLNADMTCVKEEITSEDEEMEESNGQPTNLNSMVSSVHAGSSREYSAAVDDSNTSGNNVQIGVRRNSFSPYSSQDGCSIQNANKTFNPGDGLSATSAEESHASSATLAYVCPYCCESHRPTEALQVHLRLKHPSKPSFICDCGKVFTKQILLTDHKKKCDL